MLSIITLPGTDLFTATGTTGVYATNMFNEFLPITLLFCGLAIGALLIKFLIGKGLKGAVVYIFGNKRKRYAR